MAQCIKIHPQTPQAHLIRKVVACVQSGGVIVYPTDSSYALACRVGDKSGIERMRRIRGLDKSHKFTLVCRDLSELSTYAQVTNTAYRYIRKNTPGPYTFILPATREVPRRLQHPNRKTIGIRVPDNPVALSLLETLDEPLLSTTLQLPGSELPLIEPAAIYDMLSRQVDIVIDAGFCGMEPTTVVDLVEPLPRILRYGKGDPAPFL